MTNVILLSGGVDSTCVAQWLRPNFAITIDYGHKAALAEIAAATQVAQLLDLRHSVVSVDCSSLGSGLMVGQPIHAKAPMPEWWPFRNQMLVTFAAMYGLAMNLDEILIGSIKTDHVFKDGRPEFIHRIDQLISYQEGSIRVRAPAHHLTQLELAKVSKVSKELIAHTHSCHTASIPCGHCRGCEKRDEFLERSGLVSIS